MADSLSKEQLKCIATLASKLGFTKEEKQYWVNRFSNEREISSKFLTKEEATQMIEFLIDKFNNNQEKTEQMSKRMYGSMNFTAMLNAAKSGHSAFRRAESNGNIYVNITQWLNDEKDAKGNDSAITLSSSKEKKAEEKKIYIANLKYAEGGGGDVAVTPGTKGNEDVDNFNPDDLPF